MSTAAAELAADLERGLKRLKLRAIRRMAPEVLQTAKVQRWSPEELLRTLVEAEIGARDEANLAARLRVAAFPVRKSLEEFKVRESVVPQATFDYLASLEWIRAKENVVLVGPADITADRIRFERSARAGLGDLATPRSRWDLAAGARLAPRGRRDPSSGHAARWHAERVARCVDGPVRRRKQDRGRMAVGSSRGPRAAHGPGAARRAPAARSVLRNELGSPPSSANHLEVSPVREHTIAPVRQLRLVLSDAAAVSSAPEEVWDSLPEERRREILVRLAPLLHRWLVRRRGAP